MIFLLFPRAFKDNDTTSSGDIHIEFGMAFLS
jgi:hypothetical protein